MEILVVVLEDCQGGVIANSSLFPALQHQHDDLALGPVLIAQRDELDGLQHTRFALSQLRFTSGCQAGSNSKQVLCLLPACAHVPQKFA